MSHIHQRPDYEAFRECIRSSVGVNISPKLARRVEQLIDRADYLERQIMPAPGVAAPSADETPAHFGDVVLQLIRFDTRTGQAIVYFAAVSLETGRTISQWRITCDFYEMNIFESFRATAFRQCGIWLVSSRVEHWTVQIQEAIEANRPKAPDSSGSDEYFNSSGF